MYLALSSKPRRVHRTKTKRYRAKLKTKYKARRARLYQVGRR